MTKVGYEYKMLSDLRGSVTMVAGNGAKPCGKDFLKGGNSKKGQNRDRVGINDSFCDKFVLFFLYI